MFFSWEVMLSHLVGLNEWCVHAVTSVKMVLFTVQHNTTHNQAQNPATVGHNYMWGLNVTLVYALDNCHSARSVNSL